MFINNTKRLEIQLIIKYLSDKLNTVTLLYTFVLDFEFLKIFFIFIILANSMSINPCNVIEIIM